MFKALEKFWPIVSIFLTLALLASLFFWPGAARLFSLTVMGLSLSAIVVFSVRRHVQAYQDGKVPRQLVARSIAIDVSGILVSMAVALLVARWIGVHAAQVAGKIWGVTAGVLAALLAGLAAGFGVSLSVRWSWGKLTKPRHPNRVESNQ